MDRQPQQPQQSWPQQPLQPQQGWQQSQPDWQQPQQPQVQQPWPQQPQTQQPWPPQGWQPQQPQQPWPHQPQQGWQQPQLQAQQPQPQQPLVGKQRPHHSYIWLGSIQAIVGIAVAGVIAGFSGIAAAIAENGIPSPAELLIGGGIAVVVVLALVALVVGITWWSYKHLWFELGDEEFNLYSGIFNKKHVHVPYRRVQSVDQRATLLQRIFGVCTVSIDTAGGSNNKAISVPYLQKAQAEQLRAELFARKQYILAAQQRTEDSQAVPGNVLDAPAELWQEVGGLFAGTFVDESRVTYEYGMTNKELVLTGLTNNTAFVLVIVGLIAGASQLFGSVTSIIPGSEEAAMGLAESALRVFGGNIVAAIIAALLVASVAVWALSALGSVVSYGGFKARRRANRIEVEHGLLQHSFQGVDVDRVQSVIVKQGFIRRLFGYGELSLGKIDAMTAEDSQSGQQGGISSRGLVIHPFVKMERVPEILAGIIPEFADVPAETKQLPKVALRRALLRRVLWQGSGFWLAVVTTISVLLLAVVASLESLVIDPVAQLYARNAVIAIYAVCVLLAVLDAVGAVLWVRGSGFAFNRRFMSVSNGGFSSERVSFPRNKIQFGFVRTNPFQRSAGTATVVARTAAGVGGTSIKLVDAAAQDAEEWLMWLEPRK